MATSQENMTPCTPKAMFSQPGAVGPGAYELHWRLPQRTAEADTVTVSLRGEPASAVQGAVRSVPGDAAALAVALDRDAYVAGVADAITAEIAVADAVGNPTPGTVQVEVDLGEVSAATEQRTGTYHVTWRLPGNLQAREQAHLVARLHGAERAEPGATARASLRLSPGPPAVLRVEGSASAVYADGTNSVRLKVQVIDEFGNRALSAPVVRVDPGRVERVVPAERGTYIVEYRPPRMLRPGTANIQVRAGAAPSENLTLDLQPANEGWTVAANAGILSDLDRTRAPVVAVDAGYWFSAFAEGLGLLMHLEAFAIANEKKLTTSGGIALDVRAETLFLALAASTTWRREVAPQWLLWGGVDGGLVRAHTRMKIGPQHERAESAVVPMVRSHVSAARRLDPGCAFVELSWRWQGDPDRRILSGQMKTVGASVGYRFDAL